MKLDKRQANASATTLWVEYFRPYGMPPSPLHEALQNAAMQAGWIPPWDREEQRSNKREAGKRSGLSRAGLAQIRQSLVNLAREQLNPEQRHYSPYSEASINALEEKYRSLLTKDVSDLDIVLSSILSVLSEADRKSLKKTSRETLKKDLKALRKMRGVSRQLRSESFRHPR